MSTELKRAISGALTVFAFSVLWIITTDALVARLEPTDYGFAQTVKGFVYVTAVAVLVFWLLYMALRQSRSLLEQRSSMIEAESFRMSSLLLLSLNHDMRNIVMALSLNVSFLDDSIAAEDDESREVLGDVIELTTRLSKLSDRMSLRRLNDATLFSPRKALDDYVDLLNRSQLLKGSVTLTVKADPPEQFGSLGRLEQMFANLILNGDQATENGKPVEVTLDATPKTIVYTVADQGCGLSVEALAKIWQPTYTTKSSGSGLGMLVVQEAVQSFGGRIWVTSTPGVGTFFRFEFPRSDGDRDAGSMSAETV